MKQNDQKQDDPLPIEETPQKDSLDNFNLFYEALPFEPSFSDRIAPRLRRPSKLRS